MFTKALRRTALLMAGLLMFATADAPAKAAAPGPKALPAAVATPDGAFGATPTMEPVRIMRSARFRAAGDLMMHEKQLRIARQGDDRYDFHPQYALVADILANADYTVANLETTVGRYRNRAYSGFPMFNAPESLLEAVRDAGVDFLTLANNHMLDRYFEGLKTTVDNVERFGFAHGGANRTPGERNTPVVVEVNGIRIGMLCYTQMTNGMEAYCNAAVKEYGINYLRSADFDADVRALRDAGAEVIFAMPHWGEEYRRKPEANTVALARRMIAAGVDVVLGSHPHMAQPVEFLQVETAGGERRDGLVAYSLGNFISNMAVQYTDSGILLDFTVQERQEGGFSIQDVRCVPIYCWRQSDMIRAVSSMRYLEECPEGMDGDTWARLKASYRELRELIDDDIPMIAE